MRRRLGRLTVCLSAALCLAAGAEAYFTATGTGSAQASVATITGPSNVIAQQSGTSITVSWDAATLTTGGSVQGYRVARSDGANVCGTPTLVTALQCTDTNVPSGTYTYTVTAVYNSWDAGATSAAITVVTAPTLSSTPPNPSATASASFAFSGGGMGVSYQCQLDGGGFSSCTSPKSHAGLADGSHTFMVRAVQGSSTGPSATYTWTINTAAPTITAQPANPSASTGPSFSFSDTGYTSFKCQLDGGGFTACSSPKAYASLATGSHTFQVKAVDANGVETSTASYTWTINTAAPTTTSEPTSTSASASPAFSFSHSAYTSFQCKLDSGSYTSCTSPKAYTSVADGSHTFQVEALDANGVATSPASYTWTINTAAPTITAEPANPSFSAGASFSFSHAVYTTFKCQLDGGGFSTCTSSTSYSALAGGSHTFQVEALDADGVATSAASYTWKTGLFWRASSTAKASSATSVAIPVPGGTVAGDVMVAFVANDDTTTGHIPTAPVGWTQAPNNPVTCGCGHYVAFWHVATSSEPSSYTFTTTASTLLAGGIDVYGGENTTSPIQATGTPATGNGASATAPSVTTTAANELVIVSTAFGWGGTPDTKPSGTTDRGVVTATGGLLGDSITEDSADFMQATAGATPTKAFTLSGFLTYPNWGTQTIALNPA